MMMNCVVLVVNKFILFFFDFQDFFCYMIMNLKKGNLLWEVLGKIFVDIIDSEYVGIVKVDVEGVEMECFMLKVLVNVFVY